MTALPGMHYCEEHQGNHSHYSQKNCDLCNARERIAELDAELVFHQAHVGELVAQLVEARKDAERLEWVMRKVSGAEWRRLGVYVVANCDRSAIDAALAKEQKP